MTPVQIEEALKLSDECIRKKYTGCLVRNPLDFIAISCTETDFADALSFSDFLELPFLLTYFNNQAHSVDME